MKRFALFLLLAAGCGGSDDPPAMMMTAPPPVTSTQPTAAQKAAAAAKCETLISTWCARTADCWLAIEPRYVRSELMAECRSGFKSAIDCGAAVGVSASYDRCIGDMAEMTCTAVTANPPLLPQSCNGAILVPL